MKKRTVLLLMASGLLFASCASNSGWSCCKRYGKAPEKEKVRKTDNPDQKPLV